MVCYVWPEVRSRKSEDSLSNLFALNAYYLVIRFLKGFNEILLLDFALIYLMV